MWDFLQARSKVVEVAKGEFSTGSERVALGQACGRVLAETVHSPINVPTRDYSAMDGYAVCTRDFVQGMNLTLPVVGECQTGHPSLALRPGTCARIFTGAAIPEGADAVVMQENTNRTGEQVTFAKHPASFENVRRAGEDLRQGAVVLEAGTRLSAFHLGLLASVERSEVHTAQKPRVLILCTGDELRPPGSSSKDGSLAESNSVTLEALITQVGGQAVRGPIVCDKLDAMKHELECGARRADVLVTVGGVSVGDHDLVAPALEALGAEIYFHKVRIKPGKPVLFGRLHGCLVLGLPGNPSSAQVTFSLFGAPLIRTLQGDQEPVPEFRTARLTHDFSQKSGRVGFYRARVQAGTVSLHSNQASGAATAMAWANSLAVLEADVTDVARDSSISVLAYNDI